MFLRYILSTILLFLSNFAVEAQITAEAALDSTKLTIGDQLQLHLSVKHSEDIRVNDIDVESLKQAEGFEILAVSAWDSLSKGLLQKHLIIQVWDSGYYFIPPIDIYYNRGGETRSVSTNELAFSVSTIPQNERQLAPIKPIEEEPRSLEDYIWLILLVLAAALIVLAVRFFSRQKEPEIVIAPIIKLPPHEIALKALKELEAKELWQKGAVKAYHSELSKILRTYLEGRYNVQALEMTTSEIQAQLKKLDFDSSWTNRLTTMLQAVDLVKFAKAKPSESFHVQSLEDVRAFVLATKQETIVEEVEEKA
ncbi:MAG: hypothetical protein AAF849_17960 [Bacteroidota bacterium]